MRCPDIEELIQFARQQASERDAAIVDHIAVCEKCRHELRIINETLAADDWMMPDGYDDVGSVIPKCRDDVRRYIKIASKVTADRWGKMTIAPGDRMIVDPVTKECVPATKENVELFKCNGMSLYINPDTDMQSNLNVMRNCTRGFGTALGMNMEALKGAAIPDYNLPWWVKLVPSPLQVSFRNCREIPVRQSDFIEHLGRRGVIPSSDDIRHDVWEDIKNSNLFRVYELRGWGVVFHVYSIFVTHIAVEKHCGITKLLIKPAGDKVYKAVADFVKAWKGHLEKPNCKCLSIGAFGGWDKMNVVELPDSVQVLSSPNNDGSGTWTVRHNSLEHMRPIYRTLVYRLYPESWATWHDRICEVLKHDSFECSMTVARMADISKVPQYCVAEIFEDLRKSDKRWRSVKNKVTGELALAPANGSSDAGSFVSLQSKWPWLMLDGSLLVLQTLLIQSICREIKLWNVLGASTVFFVLIVFLVLKNNMQRKIKE
ncbi:MAG: hypothetical protein IJ173_12940 [Kiritimatiellae bacterium]|nr:hypothetical protein [Kiritimatiellia bacterium]MBQ8126760.1 hypothetical protein [Kiritimatiellia bacterium]